MKSVIQLWKNISFGGFFSADFLPKFWKKIVLFKSVDIKQKGNLWIKLTPTAWVVWEARS